jgi:hypothetical protein
LSNQSNTYEIDINPSWGGPNTGLSGNDLPGVDYDVSTGANPSGVTVEEIGYTDPSTGQTHYVTPDQTDGDDYATVNGTNLSFSANVVGSYYANVIDQDATEQALADLSQDGSDAPLSETFVYQLSDGSSDSITYDLNDVLLTGVGGTVQTQVGTPVAVTDASGDTPTVEIPDADPDATNVVIALTTSDGSGQYHVDPNASGVTVSGDDTADLTLDGTLSQVNAALAQLTFTATEVASVQLLGQASAGFNAMPNATPFASTDSAAAPPAPPTVSSSQVQDYNIFPNTAGVGTQLSLPDGGVVVEISTDGQTYMAVSSDGPTSVNGPYLDYSVQSDGQETAFLSGSAQSLVDAIDANAFGSDAGGPLTDSLYYVVEDQTGAYSTYELTSAFSDIDFEKNGAGPNFGAVTVEQGVATNIGGITATVAPDDDGSPADPDVSVTLYVGGDTDPGGGLSVTQITGVAVAEVTSADGSASGLTLSGLQSDVNNALDSLTFTGTRVGDYVLSGAGSAGQADTTGDSYVNLETLHVACYCPGSLILTDRGEVAVESLVIGDRLVTGSGEARALKWIGRRSYAGRFVAANRRLLPVCVKAGAMGAGLPRRDLWVSPLHAMVVEGCLVPAGALVNGVSVVQAAEVEEVRYIHLELEEHSVIYAEGAASESFVDDDSRAMFQNAHTFAELYPDARSTPAIYCLPRVEDGEELERLRAVVDARAGLSHASASLPRLLGHLDRAEGGLVQGWAQAEGHPEAPVCLDVVVDGVVVTTVLANRYRSDLEAAGLGSGRHSFSVALDLAPGAQVEVRRSLDARPLGQRALPRAA